MLTMALALAVSEFDEVPVDEYSGRAGAREALSASEGQSFARTREALEEEAVSRLLAAAATSRLSGLFAAFASLRTCAMASSARSRLLSMEISSSAPRPMRFFRPSMSFASVFA